MKCHCCGQEMAQLPIEAKEQREWLNRANYNSEKMIEHLKTIQVNTELIMKAFIPAYGGLDLWKIRELVDKLLEERKSK